MTAREMTQNSATILVLEDEMLIALELEVALQNAGYRPVVLRTRADAHSWLDGNAPTIAVIDINLADGICDDIADRLVSADIPFVVHAGAIRHLHQGSPFEKGLWLGKPAPMPTLIDLLRSATRG